MSFLSPRRILDLQIEKILVLSSEGAVVDYFIIPSQLQEGSISKDLRGDIWIQIEPSPNRLTQDSTLPILINEYAVTQETDQSELLMEPMTRSFLTLEILSIQSNEIDLSSKLRIDFGSEDVEPVELISWNIFDQFSTFTVDCPDSENPLFITLQLFDSEEGWIGLQHLILKPSELVHKSRIPDGAVWDQNAQNSFGESNGRQSVGSQSLGIPEVFALYQNFPNPFNPITTLSYDLPKDSDVRLAIFDMLGDEVATLVNSHQQAGFKSVQWDGTGSMGRAVSAGVYLYRIEAGEFVETKKMLLLK